MALVLVTCYGLLKEIDTLSREGNSVNFPQSCIYSAEVDITKTRLFTYIENFTTKKLKFLDEKSDIFSYSYSKT